MVVSDEEGNLCLVVLAVLISKSVEVAGLVQLVLEHVALADTLIQGVPVADHWVGG